MNLHLVDIDPDVVSAWEIAFEGENVEVQCNDILRVAVNTVVSPANSYGFMDGGIDRVYSEFFGLRPQTEIQEAIAKREEGFLPVGASLLVQTGNEKIPYMIAAPTMHTPSAVPAANCFYAMFAALETARKNSDLVTNLFCPGLGTLTGQVSAIDSAMEMANAFKKWKTQYA